MEKKARLLRKSKSLTIEASSIIKWASRLTLKQSNPKETNLRTPIITEEGFEIVKNELPGLNTVVMLNRKESSALALKTEAQSQYRVRKFSWEEVDDLDTAEYISNRLAKNLLVRLYKTDSIDSSLLPNLTDFEFFIKNLQYSEFIQNYHESIDHAKLKNITKNLMLAGSSTSISMPMSSTSIYLSHYAATNKIATPPSAKTAMHSLITNRNSKAELKMINNSTWVSFSNY
jgi:hypothetical protein